MNTQNLTKTIEVPRQSHICTQNLTKTIEVPSRVIYVHKTIEVYLAESYIHETIEVPSRVIYSRNFVQFIGGVGGTFGNLCGWGGGFRHTLYV